MVKMPKRPHGDDHGHPFVARRLLHRFLTCLADWEQARESRRPGSTHAGDISGEGLLRKRRDYALGVDEPRGGSRAAGVMQQLNVADLRRGWRGGRGGGGGGGGGGRGGGRR